MEIQTYYFVKFNPVPSYEFIKNEISMGLITFIQFEHRMLKWVYDYFDNADVLFDFKYFHCSKNHHRLKAYYNILQEIILILWIITTEVLLKLTTVYTTAILVILC